MEVTVNEGDLRAVIQQQSNEIAMLKANVFALGRTISEMEMAHASETRDESKDSEQEHPGTEAIGKAAEASGRNSARAKAPK